LETCRRIGGLVDFIAERYRNTAEIGIGHFPDIARALIEKGVRVFATDIRPFHHEVIRFVIDDVTSPDMTLYKGVDLIYSMRPPTELVPYMKRLAKTISADLIVKMLSSEYPEGFHLMRNRDTTFFCMES
jgi:uncharacterized UPF0146 family protein